MRLTSRCLLFLRQLQRLHYSLAPVRLVGCVLNAALMESVFISSSDASAAAKELYELSQRKEGNKGTAPVTTTADNTASRRYRSATVGSRGSSSSLQPQRVTTGI